MKALSGWRHVELPERREQRGMGYREADWSLPLERQVLIARQNIYDGTWEKTHRLSWMFVPLVEYQGGAAATLEPLKDHLRFYEQHPVFGV